MTNSLGVPEHALTAWAVLSTALIAQPDTPCAGPSRNDWHGSRKQQARAAEACLDCPLMAACATYARIADEPDGVWGGITQHERAEQRATRRRTA
ncbi:WhiB family transcriptional regulator [Brachybacterium alimentarium]|uniref:WhiB family transcriptional regulator n=1 Tax=Brachybacterium alimentarium TaxID=47845 RepID=UPI00403DA411